MLEAKIVLSNSVRKHGHLKFGAGGRAATGRWNARGPGRFLIKEWEMSVLQPYFKGTGSLARCMAHWAWCDRPRQLPTPTEEPARRPTLSNVRSTFWLRTRPTGCLKTEFRSSEFISTSTNNNQLNFLFQLPPAEQKQGSREWLPSREKEICVCVCLYRHMF